MLQKLRQEYLLQFKLFSCVTNPKSANLFLIKVRADCCSHGRLVHSAVSTGSPLHVIGILPCTEKKLFHCVHTDCRIPKFKEIAFLKIALQ